HKIVVQALDGRLAGWDSIRLVPPAADPSPTGSKTTGAGRQLPFTGAGGLGLTLVGAALAVAIGTACLAAARRRQS
ncbi:MAG: hypothetical protein LBO20_04275, partial [Bifidobacteriaceae bacterium]|nr:hypothetical protein [Bifidobacteriaceae bacterium]